MEKQIDQNITKQDLELMEDALSQLENAWHNLMNTNIRMSGDCNEIIENKYPFCSSFDDVYHNDIRDWLKSCRKNIQKYRDHLDTKTTKLIRITRPAWIKETYRVEFTPNDAIIPTKGMEGMQVSPLYARQWLEDGATVQLETEVSCHMDSSNAIGADIHEDEFAEITLDEVEEVS